MKFSLIMATFGRDQVIADFLQSLKAQTYKNFELIVVDQNKDDRVKNICDKFSSDISIKIIKAAEPSLSKARNIGLKNAASQVIAFPDDDCQYSPDLLETAKTFFDDNQNYNILTGAQIDTVTKQKVEWLLPEPAEISEKNILRVGLSISIFIRKKQDLPLFDENFGIGGTFGATEETDFLFRLINLGYRGFYDPSFGIYHPKADRKNFSLAKYYSYSIALGAFFKKHLFFAKRRKLFRLFYQLTFIRPIGGMLLSIIKLKPYDLALHVTTMTGRIAGLFKYTKNIYKNSLTFDKPCE